MLTFILILIIVASLLLILFVLAQNPKGGGLSATFGGAGSQIIGARQTADFLEKATWYFAIGIVVLVIATNFFIPTGGNQGAQSRVANQASEIPMNIPTNPQGAPSADQGTPPAQQDQQQPMDQETPEE